MGVRFVNRSPLVVLVFDVFESLSWKFELLETS